MDSLLAWYLSQDQWLPMALYSFVEIKRNNSLLYRVFLVLFYHALFMHYSKIILFLQTT